MGISYVNVGRSALLSDWVYLHVFFLERPMVFEILQYMSASRRFISCLLRSFILVRYSVCHYQKHCKFNLFFGEKITGVFLMVTGKYCSVKCSSLNELFCFQLYIWIEFPVRLPSHQVDRSLYILRCALKNTCTIFLLCL